MEKSRNMTFDIAKGIGIVLVVIGHYIPAGAPVWYVEFAKFIYHFHMPLFFVIAGFFYDRSSRQERYPVFVWNKFQRLMFPYFILSWAIVGVKIAVGGVMRVDHPVTAAALFRVFYLPEAGYFLWFVYVLFLIFCIAPLFKPGKRLIVLSLLAVGLAFWREAPNWLCLAQLSRNLIFFVAGMWIARTSWLERMMYRGSLLWLGLTVALAVVYAQLPLGAITSALSIILGITGSFMVMSVSQLVSQQGRVFARVLNRLGIMSMTIYLFHTWIMGGEKAILTHILSGGNIIEFILSALFIIGTGIVFPIWLYQWVWAKNKFTSRIFK